MQRNKDRVKDLEHGNEAFGQPEITLFISIYAQKVEVALKGTRGSARKDEKSHETEECGRGDKREEGGKREAPKWVTESRFEESGVLMMRRSASATIAGTNRCRRGKGDVKAISTG